jgi:hypothetical protein
MTAARRAAIRKWQAAGAKAHKDSHPDHIQVEEVAKKLPDVITNSPDHGCDPLGDGRFRMVPSGDIVDLEERNRRLAKRKIPQVENDCLGLSWQQIAIKQGGFNSLDITRQKK